MRQFKPGVNWDDIRQRYEGGESANAISKTVDVSKQAILKHAKGKGWSPDPARREFLARQRKWQPVVAPPVSNGANGAALRLMHGKDTPESRAKVLASLEMGASFEIAAKAAGISHVTLADWRKRDSAFAEQCTMARAQKAVDWIGVINKAATVTGDWKAAEAGLKRHEDTKADWGDTAKAGGPSITVNLSVDRGSDGLTIDATPTEAGE